MSTRTPFLLKKLRCTSNVQLRWLSTKPMIKLIDEVEKSIEDNTLKPRKQPGIIKSPAQFPKWIVEAMNNCFDDIDKAHLLKQREKFANYLFSRKLPIEDNDARQMYKEIEAEFLKSRIKNLTESEIEEMQKKIKGKVLMKFKQKNFQWKPVEYDKFKSLLYMITRSAPEYAVLYTIFNEIKTRDPNFSPSTMFDFGSGIGSVLWAANTHWTKINEYVGVDISPHINDLSEKIFENSPRKVKGVFRREYMPLSNLKYDLVVSAYSLLDLPSAKTRLEVIANLWRKTNKYLVIVEQGTNAGFRVVNEARDFVRHVMDNFDSNTPYFIFAPCPHDKDCPRLDEPKKTPCNFITPYDTLPLLGPITIHKELYSYVVLKKDSRTEKDNWDRLVRPTLIRSKRAMCRMCSPNGQLKEVVFTAAKYGKPLYKCARHSKWGHRLPLDPNIKLNDSVDDQTDELKEEILENSESTNEQMTFSSKAPFSTTKKDDDDL